MFLFSVPINGPTFYESKVLKLNAHEFKSISKKFHFNPNEKRLAKLITATKTFYIIFFMTQGLSNCEEEGLISKGTYIAAHIQYLGNATSCKSKDWLLSNQQDCSPISNQERNLDNCRSLEDMWYEQVGFNIDDPFLYRRKEVFK